MVIEVYPQIRFFFHRIRSFRRNKNSFATVGSRQCPNVIQAERLVLDGMKAMGSFFPPSANADEAILQIEFG